jgi:hypothetical protein
MKSFEETLSMDKDEQETQKIPTIKLCKVPSLNLTPQNYPSNVPARASPSL